MRNSRGSESSKKTNKELEISENESNIEFNQDENK